jgi:hypothetical protein
MLAPSSRAPKGIFSLPASPRSLFLPYPPISNFPFRTGSHFWPPISVHSTRRFFLASRPHYHLNAENASCP